MSSYRPPKFSIHFFKWFCQEKLQETILGDLEEQFDEDLESLGPRKARWRFIWNVIRFFRPSIIKKINRTQKLNYFDMYNHYLKTGLRNIFKHKTFSFLNIFGLAVGIASCLTILQYVAFESSYDQFHSRKNEIYRVDTEHFRDSILLATSKESGFELGPTIKKTIPGIEVTTRTHVLEDGAVVTYNKKLSKKPRQFLEEQGKIYFVDQSFFKLFDYKLLKGNRESLLEAPNSIVITDAMWKKYMPDVDDPVGKLLSVDGGRYPGTFQVTGVIETLPENTLYSFGFLMSITDLLKSEQYAEDDGWGWTNFTTYLMVNQGTSIEKVAKQAKSILIDRNEEGDDALSYVIFTSLNDLHLRDKTKQGGVTTETLPFLQS